MEVPNNPRVLEEFGPRICIMGPSNSGKSTLAFAIGRDRDLPVVHLDQLYHEPMTDWQARPAAEFIALHDQALLSSSWVIEGNYSRCLAQRLERATGFILLDISMATSIARYLRRSWVQRDRVGGLDGGRDSIKWAMLRHITITTRQNRRRYSELFERVSLPKVRLSSAREVTRFYRTEHLCR